VAALCLQRRGTIAASRQASLAIAVLAVIAGADGWEDTVVWAKARVSWLNTFLLLSSGVPCPDPFRRVFRAVDPTKFAAGFASMLQRSPRMTRLSSREEVQPRRS
jgi:hypothetical protein